MLLQTGFINKPTYEFTTTRKIFEKRFECFQQFRQPPPLSYDDFEKGTDFSSVSWKDLITSSSDCFKNCRILLDKMKNRVESKSLDFLPISMDEIMCTTKVCIANSLLLLKVSQYIDKCETKVHKVSFDFDTHRQFCSISIS